MGDGFSDGYEVEKGSDPGNPSSVPYAPREIKGREGSAPDPMVVALIAYLIMGLIAAYVAARSWKA